MKDQVNDKFKLEGKRRKKGKGVGQKTRIEGTSLTIRKINGKS